MACKECGNKIARDNKDIYVKKNKIKLCKKTGITILLAILLNGILAVSSYNYVQYVVYKENIQIIELENYKNEQFKIEQTKVEQIKTEQNDTQFQNMSRTVYIE